MDFPLARMVVEILFFVSLKKEKIVRGQPE